MHFVSENLKSYVASFLRSLWTYIVPIQQVHVERRGASRVCAVATNFTLVHSRVSSRTLPLTGERNGLQSRAYSQPLGAFSQGKPHGGVGAEADERYTGGVVTKC